MGPTVSFPPLDFSPFILNAQIEDLDSMIFVKESEIKDLKPDNEARIVWADSTKVKTKYAIVYLHGFSASQEEGNPVHRDVAKEFGYNLYLSRLYDHGRDDKNTFKDNSPQKLFDSAKEALEIGKMIGDSIILMSCSTGGTLSVLLADEPLISSFVMYSPNFDLYDRSSYLITKPWGVDVLDIVMKGKYNHVNYDSLGNAYWNPDYHTDGVVALRWILDNYMTDAYFERINKPVFIGYYYKDEDHKDEVVSIEAMKNFMETINTPYSKKSLIAFPNTGTHVISSHVMSKDIESVRRETIKFLKELGN
jgi:esterase/lipase